MNRLGTLTILATCLPFWVGVIGCASTYAPRPPARFTGNGEFKVQVVAQPSVACRDRASTGCFGLGWIILPNPCDWPAETYAQLFCHEKGHALGWPANHPEK